MKKNKLIIALLFIFSLSVSQVISAENLGVYGEVFPIVEVDMLQFIHERLIELNQSGQLKQMQNDFDKKVVEHTLRPHPVERISKAIKPRTFYYNPMFTLQHNIYDNQGNLLAEAGTTINPLNKIHLNETLFFINADDRAEIAWIKQILAINKENKNIQFYKIILVQGNIAQASKDLGRIYFDQNGVLTKKLGILHVPAIVSQSGDQLVIREVSV